MTYSQTDPFFKASVEKISEQKPPVLTIEDEAQIRTVKEQLDKVVSLGKAILPDIMGVVENIEDPGRLADLVASNLGLKTEQAQEVLEITDPIQRLKRVSEILQRESELLTVQHKIQSEARGEIDKTQREYFLREQLKAIQKELGDIDERAEEIKEFRKKIEEAKMPEKVKKEAEKQLKRLEKMHPDSAEAATVRTYLDWIVELPWSKSTTDNLDIKAAEKVLSAESKFREAVRKLKAYVDGLHATPMQSRPINQRNVELIRLFQTWGDLLGDAHRALYRDPQGAFQSGEIVRNWGGDRGCVSRIVSGDGLQHQGGIANVHGEGTDPVEAAGEGHQAVAADTGRKSV